jgi:hypothetical protein
MLAGRDHREHGQGLVMAREAAAMAGIVRGGLLGDPQAPERGVLDFLSGRLIGEQGSRTSQDEDER